MDIFSFGAHFEDEQSCRLHVKEQRDKGGIVCNRCGGTEHYWLKNKRSYQCKACRARRTLRSGTIMESPKLPFLVWYRAMCLMSATKKGLSSRGAQRQLGLKRYGPVRAMMHELRDAMGQRDDLYNLEGMIGADEGHFDVQAPKDGHGPQRAGRGSNTKSNVMVMAESTVLEDIETGETDRHCRYFKAKVLTGRGAGEADGVLKSAIDGERPIVFSDKSTSYVNIEDHVDIHISKKSNGKTTKKILKWVHIAIANAKGDLQKFHKIKTKYLQLYMNESIYKLNRRYFGTRIFDRLVIAGITASGR